MSLESTGGDYGQRAGRPRQFGNFQLGEILGRGGIGVVYRATGAQGDVALKVLAPHALDEEELTRFDREAKTGRQLQHPGIVRVLEWGSMRGIPYQVMELVEGESLRQAIKRQGLLPIDECLRIGMALCSAVSFAHSAGVLHRDLKPGNVLLDAQGAPKLCDLGMAKRYDAKSLTQSGTFLGTPAYISPEQARDAKRVDERADVYGLGAILYAALTGRPPLLPTGNLHELMQAIDNEIPAAPRTLRTDVPRWLDALVSSCLAKDPDDRPPSASALLEALRQGVGGPDSQPEAGDASGDGALGWPLRISIAVLLVLCLTVWGALLARRAGRGDASEARASPTPVAVPAPVPVSRDLNLEAWNALPLAVTWVSSERPLSLTLVFFADGSPGRVTLRVRRLQAFSLAGQEPFVTDSNRWSGSFAARIRGLQSPIVLELKGKRVTRLRGRSGLEGALKEADLVTRGKWFLEETMWDGLLEKLRSLEAGVVGQLERARFDEASPMWAAWSQTVEGEAGWASVRRIQLAQARPKEDVARFLRRHNTTDVVGLVGANGLRPSHDMERTPGALTQGQRRLRFSTRGTADAYGGIALELPRTLPATPTLAAFAPKTPIYSDPYGRLIGYVHRKQIVYRGEPQVGWVPVRWGSTVGWIDPKGLAQPNLMEVDLAEVVREGGQPLEVYDALGREAGILGFAVHGQRYVKRRKPKEEGWSSIQFSGRVGFVHSSALRTVKPEPSDANAAKSSPAPRPAQDGK